MKKYNPYFLMFLFTLGISASGCRPDKSDNPGEPVERPSNFDEIKASNTFNWETSKHVLVSLNGYNSAQADEQAVLILSDPDGNVVFKGTHKTVQNFQIELRIPVSVNKLRVQFGVCDKLLPVNMNTVSGNLLPVLPEVL